MNDSRIRQPDAMAWLDAPGLLHMGLTAVGEQQWLAPYDQQEYLRLQAHKTAALAQDPTLLLVEEIARPALREWHGLLQDNLRRHHAAVLQQAHIDMQATADQSAAELLQQMTHWVPDDICVLQLDSASDEYQLTAASVCSPGLWHPATKLQRSLARIHAPVPNFAARLGPAVARVFQRLRAGNAVVRFNWSLQGDTALNRQPPTEPVIDAATPLFLRIERQTLLRLPDTGAMIFLIRTSHCALDELSARYGEEITLGRLLAAIDGLSADEQDYKGIHRMRVALHKYQ